jgi:hypothetical protein
VVVVVVVTVVCWARTVEATPSTDGTATAVSIRIRSCLRPGSRGSSAPLLWRDQTSFLMDRPPFRVEEIAADACKLRNTNELTRLPDLRLLDYDLDAPVLWLRHTITGRHQRFSFTSRVGAYRLRHDPLRGESSFDRLGAPQGHAHVVIRRADGVEWPTATI